MESKSLTSVLSTNKLVIIVLVIKLSITSITGLLNKYMLNSVSECECTCFACYHDTSANEVL